MLKPYSISKLGACEHLNIIPLSWKKVKISKASAIFDHILLMTDYPSFDDFETVVKYSNEFRLLLRDFILISCDMPLLNKYPWTSIPLDPLS